MAQALRPYPQYLSIVNEGAAVDFSTYNSFQWKFQKQFSSGLSFLVGYTLSKDLSDTNTQEVGYFAASTQDVYNHRLEKSINGGDFPQQVIGQYVYDLPVGKGKKFLNNNRALNYILGGWELSGVHTYQSGTPVALVTEHALPTMSSGALTAAVLRPNINPGVPQKGQGCSGFNPASSLALNPKAFSDPAPWTFGDAGPYQPNVRSCGLLDENFSLNKYIPLYKERARMQIGANAFNLFNRHPWNGPNGDIDSSAFGTINGTQLGGRVIQVHARIDF